MEEDIKMLKDRIEYHKLDPEDDNGRVSFMLEEIDQLENILNRLEQDERVIDKAIEYIERNARKCGNGEEWFESSYCCTSLLNILKENQKEV